MKFTQEYQISSHDLAHNNRVRPSVLLRYMMETANRHMYTQKPSYGELLAQGLAFLVSRTHLVIHKDLRAYDRVEAYTWAVEPKGASFDRCYQLLCDGEVVAEAYSVFGLLNINTQKLCRADDVTFSYGSDEPLEISTRFRLPDIPLDIVGEREIRYADIDCNAHMNNTNYPDMLCDYIPDIDRLRITDVQVQYVKEAPLGERLTIRMGWLEINGRMQYAFETVRQDGNINIRALIEAESAEAAPGF